MHLWQILKRVSQLLSVTISTLRLFIREQYGVFLVFISLQTSSHEIFFFFFWPFIISGHINGNSAV